MACSQRPPEQDQRGSITILSVLWIAFTLLGVTAIADATHVVQQRAFIQEAADAIALAYVIKGDRAAQELEQLLRVSVTQRELAQGEVTVEVTAGGYTATSSAAVGG